MGQVPEEIFQPLYGIVGSGRVATHFCRYFDLMKIPFRHWYRSLGNSLEDILGAVPVVLLLISDSQIENFIESYPFLKKKKLVHFSGSLITPYAQGFHPLMTFTREPYDLDVYRKIPFFVQKGRFEFNEIFPALENPHYNVNPEQSDLYHALCVLSGNFTTILWDKFFSELEDRFSVPRAAAFPYLDQIVENLKRDSRSALTGPLQRRDHKTISKNLSALKNDPFQKVYEAFVEVFGGGPS